jgi:hypothetical protein
MADIPYIDQAQEVKITGQDSGGTTVNYVGADANGNLLVKDYATSATGSAVPSNASYIAGKNAGNLIGIAVDASGNIQMVGNVASGSADSGSPVKVGGVFNTTLPTLSNGQRGDLQLNSNAELIVTTQDESFGAFNITTQDIVSTTALGFNQQPIITGTPTANSTAVLTTNSDEAVVVQVSGTWTGSLQSEVSMDGGTTWYVRPIHQTGTIYTASTFTANFNGEANMAGFTNFRIRAISAMTGTAVVKLTITNNVNTVYIGAVVQNAPVDGSKQSYRAASSASFSSAATATDIFTITGSATKTIRITRISITGTQTTPGYVSFFFIKRSAANSGGTSAAVTAVPHDSNNLAATATVLQYTANPTSLGATVGTILSFKKVIQVPAVAGNVSSENIPDIYFGNSPAQSIVLRGTSQVLAINLGGVTVTGGSWLCTVEWTEE